MQPTRSIIAFTVSSGAGYGLATLLCIYSIVPGGILANANTALAGGVLGLVLVTVGLLCSTLHLANPRNAWRAFSRMRTSWLSREGVLALLFYPIGIVWLLLQWQGTDSGASAAFSVVTAAIALATVFATGMIYACLRTVHAWHTPLTPAIYLLFSLTLGALLSFAILAQSGESATVPALVALAGLGLTVAAKLAWWRRARIGPGADLAQAIGFGGRKAGVLDVGHTAGTFLTREFDYELESRRAARLKIATVVFAFILPALLIMLWAGTRTPVFAWLAAISGIIGTTMERFLFFAESRHVVSLYHGPGRV